MAEIEAIVTPEPGTQFGEDSDIDELVGHLNHGFAADIGAYDGRMFSNTYHLEKRGWDVLCVEANPLCGTLLTLNRKLVKMVACAAENADWQPFYVFEVGRQGNFSALSSLKPDPDRPVHREEKPKGLFHVNVRTLNWLLDHVGFPRLDVLTIDVEGGEGEVLDGLDLKRWQPKVIVIEDWYGERHKARLEGYGYRLHVKRGINEVYAHE
jgi:FkbM family methyltransferase